MPGVTKKTGAAAKPKGRPPKKSDKDPHVRVDDDAPAAKNGTKIKKLTSSKKTKSEEDVDSSIHESDDRSDTPLPGTDKRDDEERDTDEVLEDSQEDGEDALTEMLSQQKKVSVGTRNS